jgi:eight-cysteine-cluster-containing protein
MLGSLVAAALAVFACAGTRASSEPAPAVTGQAAIADVPTLEPAPNAPTSTGEEGLAPVEPTPEALYGQCRARVEGVSATGECASDADCTRAGCSGEVCVAASNKASAVTTCEILPCFSVLQACGCVEGLCSWSVGPSTRPLLRLPPK